MYIYNFCVVYNFIITRYSCHTGLCRRKTRSFRVLRFKCSYHADKT